LFGHGEVKKVGLATVVALTLAGADLFTKDLVRDRLGVHEQVPVIGEFVRLTHIYNPGAAFGLSIGAYSRPFFLALTLLALVALIVILLRTPASNRAGVLSITAILGGALGNLFNRLWIERGVVDWIDVGVGATRWPAFNLADSAVTLGAIGLALSFWTEDRRGRRHEIEARQAP
jgi:signal peptidase II